MISNVSTVYSDKSTNTYQKQMYWLGLNTSEVPKIAALHRKPKKNKSGKTNKTIYTCISLVGINNSYSISTVYTNK